MARTTIEHCIMVKSAGQYFPKVHEEPGDGTIYPGFLLEYDGGEVQAHSTAGGPAVAWFALEHRTPDTETYPTTAAIDIPYEDGDTVYFAHMRPGDVINAKIADGESVTQGETYLQSNGDGTLAAVTIDAGDVETSVIAVAYETVDNSLGGAPARCLVEIL
jgi:hypothetical protein